MPKHGDNFNAEKDV